MRVIFFLVLLGTDPLHSLLLQHQQKLRWKEFLKQSPGGNNSYYGKTRQKRSDNRWSESTSEAIQNMDADEAESLDIDVIVSEINTDSGLAGMNKFLEFLIVHYTQRTDGRNDVSGFRVLMIKGSPLSIVLSVDLKSHLPTHSSPYIVIGDPGVDNVNIVLSDEKTETSLIPREFPTMDDSPYAVVVTYSKNPIHDELLTLPRAGGQFQPIQLQENIRLQQIIYSISMDAVVLGRRVKTNQCDFFTTLIPNSKINFDQRYLLRDRDSPSASVKDYSLNYCCTDYQSFAPSCFKLGRPSAGSANDCSGRRFILEFEVDKMPASTAAVDESMELEGCEPNFPGLPAWRYATVDDHTYTAAVEKVMTGSEGSCSGPPDYPDVLEAASSTAEATPPHPEITASDEKRKYISDFNKAEFDKCKQHFTKPRELLDDKFSWLDARWVRGNTCIFKCKVCQRYFEDGWRPDYKHKSFLQEHGFFSFEAAKNQKAVRDHQSEELHKEAVSFYNSLKSAASRSEQLAIEEAHRREEMKLLRPTMNELELAYAQLRARGSFKGHAIFMNAVSRLGVPLGTKHRNEYALQKITSTLSASFHRRLLSHVTTENQWFSLICDGSTFRQVPYLVCLWQTLEDNRPIVYFWRLIELTNGETGEGMVSDLRRAVEADEKIYPGFQQFFKNKLLASVSDSASNMVGNRNSFYTHLKAYVGRPIGLQRCFAHKLERVIVHAVDFPTDTPSPNVREKDRKRYFKSFAKYNNALFSYYMSRGSKRFQNLVALAEELDLPVYRIHYFFEVRWAFSHRRCMSTVYKSYDALRTDLERASQNLDSDENGRKKALELYQHLSDKTFPVVTADYVDLLTIFETISLKFQKKGGVLIGNAAIIESWYSSMEQLKHEPGKRLQDFLGECYCPGICETGKCSLQQYDECNEVHRKTFRLRSRSDGVHTVKFSKFRTQLYENIQAQILSYFNPESVESYEIFNPRYFKSCSTPNQVVCADFQSCYEALPNIVPSSTPKSIEEKIQYICTLHSVSNCQQLITDWRATIASIVINKDVMKLRGVDPSVFWPEQIANKQLTISAVVRDVLNRILATAFTSSDSERAFSLVSGFRRPDRSNMTPKTMQDLLRISFNGPDVLSEQNLYNYTKEFVKGASRVDDMSTLGRSPRENKGSENRFKKSRLF